MNEENERVLGDEERPVLGPCLYIRESEVEEALRKMKNGKAVGPDNIPVEVWKSLGRLGVSLLTEKFNEVMESERMPDKWRESILIPIYKNKGDVQCCSNYRGIKLTCHTLKVWEKVIERRLRDIAPISEEQFGFAPGRGTTDAIFALRQMMEKYREVNRDLYMVFVDLEKAFDRVPREELWNSMRRKQMPEKYVNIVKDMYADSKTQIRCGAGTSEAFAVGVGVHQGSALSPFLFATVMDVVTENVRKKAPWTMMFADDIVLCAESERGAEASLEDWRKALEDRGMRVNRDKTEYMICGDARGEICLQGERLQQVAKFKYLGSTIQANGELDGEIGGRVQSGWANWRRMSGVLCDRRAPCGLKGKIHRLVVRPAVMYGSETWPMRRRWEDRLDVTEMRMLRFSCGLTRLDKVRNTLIRGTTKVTSMSNKIRESRLRWYGHVMRQDHTAACRSSLEMEVLGVRSRGRPKRRWMDAVREDFRELRLDEEMVRDRTLWKRSIRCSDPA